MIHAPQTKPKNGRFGITKMHLVVISHKVCWKSVNSPSGYVTDGGFPLQMQAISDLFASTELILPCEIANNTDGASPLRGNNLKITLLTAPKGQGLRRKINIFGWVIKNGPVIWQAMRRADAVHTPIPGDVGTIGMMAALIMRKRLFVRHCGNWLVPKTAAERFWKWSMEYFAGSRNVMLATGGATESPSAKNTNVKWIFSTSLCSDQIAENKPKYLPGDGRLKLIIACRQEVNKGTDLVIQSMPLILDSFPNASLSVVGGGSLLEKLKEQALSFGIADRVVFHGKVEQSEVLDLLKQAHLFCYPTSASEGFPKVVLEALASGLPVITTRVSVLPQLIGNGCGVLLDEPTVGAIAAAVKEICLDETKYSQMSSKAIETARQYTLENWRDCIGETLREAWGVDSLAQDISCLSPMEQL
jgi:glycosyltransferase involved in cell wall biosynthesis